MNMNGFKLLFTTLTIIEVCDGMDTHMSVYRGFQSRSLLHVAKFEGVQFWRDCRAHCHRNQNCASVNFAATEKRCTLLADSDPKPMKVGDMSAIYAAVSNRNASDVCTVSQWSSWAWLPLSVSCFHESELANVSRTRLVLQNESSLVRTCPQLYQSYIDTQYCLQFEGNCTGVATLGSDLSPTMTYNHSIIGSPIQVYNALPSIQNCRCLCQKHFKCQTASFLANGTCNLYSKVSNQGLQIEPLSAVIDLHLSDKTRLLLVGGYAGALQNKIFLIIPETATATVVGYLNVSRMTHAVGLYDNELWVHGGGARPVEVSRGLPINMQPVPELAIGTVLPSFTVGCAAVFNNKFYSCKGANCDVFDLDSLEVSHLTNAFRGTNGIPSCALSPDGELYVIGGGTITTGNFRVNVTDGTTITGPAFPTTNTPGNSGSAVWFQDTVVVCGGKGGSTVCNRFNPSTGQWIGFANMIRARYQYPLVNWGSDKIIAIAGRNWNGNRYHRAVDAYANGAWSFLMNMPYHIRETYAITID